MLDAIDLLQAAAPYELADTAAPVTPVYVRGEAYLHARQGEAAAAEFQKVLDHRGIAAASIPPLGLWFFMASRRHYRHVRSSSPRISMARM